MVICALCQKPVEGNQSRVFEWPHGYCHRTCAGRDYPTPTGPLMPELCGEEWVEGDACVLEKGHSGSHRYKRESDDPLGAVCITCTRPATVLVGYCEDHEPNDNIYASPSVCGDCNHPQKDHPGGEETPCTRDGCTCQGYRPEVEPCQACEMAAAGQTPWHPARHTCGIEVEWAQKQAASEGKPSNTVMAACGHRTAEETPGVVPPHCPLCQKTKVESLPEPKWRPQVMKLASEMEAKLQANEHKGDWRQHSLSFLFRRLKQEVEELERDPTHWSEAADIGNFAMFICDVANSRKKDEP